jgi:hypothetical protein
LERATFRIIAEFNKIHSPGSTTVQAHKTGGGEVRFDNSAATAFAGLTATLDIVLAGQLELRAGQDELRAEVASLRQQAR